MSRCAATFFFILTCILFSDFYLTRVNTVSHEDIKIVGATYLHRWNYAPKNKTSNFLILNPKRNQEDGIEQRKRTESGFRNLSQQLISKNMRFLVPAFVLSSDEIAGDECRKENDIFLAELEELKLWALKMYDSSGKFTSGFLGGNVNQFGDFDQCLSAENPERNVKAKYCLAYFQIILKDQALVSDRVEEIFDLVQSHYAFKSKMSDPGHRVPRFSTIHWALCIPRSCSHVEVESRLRRLIQNYTDGMGFDVEVRVDPEMCYVKKPFQFSVSFLIVSILFISIAAVVIISTVKDVAWDQSAAKNSHLSNVMCCFSLKRNLRQLISTERASDDLQSVHGIRMLNALLLLLSHKSMAMFFFPFSNRTYLVESLSQPWSIVARMASLYTDSFIMLSGTLASYSFCKTLRNNGKLNVVVEYTNRLVRILPLLIVTILSSTFIMPELGSGPLWGLTIDHHSNLCKNSWWKNFLFLHNYFGFENMCLTHTHHLGIDTQLFFISPILVYILHKWPASGFGLLISLAAVSTGFRYHATSSKNLSYFIYPGISVSQMMDTANFSYIIPSHRLTVYIIGLITGYVLYYCGKEYRMKPHTRKLCWTAAFGLIYCVISKAVNMSHLGYIYNENEAAIYAALIPIAWCLSLGWIIFASHTNYGGMVGRVLSSKYYMLWTRISYAVYLTQFPIFFFNVGRQKFPHEFSVFSLINIAEYTSIVMASVILTLLFDMPCNNIRKLLRHRRPPPCGTSHIAKGNDKKEV